MKGRSEPSYLNFVTVITYSFYSGFYISISMTQKKLKIMKIKEKHKDLKKKVVIAEKERNLKRGQKSWQNLRTLKKLKLNMKDKLTKK